MRDCCSFQESPHLIATGEDPSCIGPQQDLKLLLPLATGENPSAIDPRQDPKLLATMGRLWGDYGATMVA